MKNIINESPEKKRLNDKAMPKEIVIGNYYKRSLVEKKQCLCNMMTTNKNLLKSNNIDSLLLF